MKYSMFAVLAAFFWVAELLPISEIGHAGQLDKSSCHYFGNNFHCH